MGFLRSFLKRLLALAALIALTVSLGSARATAQTPSPIEINFLLSLTGGAAFLGKAMQTAFQLEEKTINDSGGVRGRPVKFVYSDDASTPQTGLQLVSGLAAKGVPVIIGSPLVSVCNAYLPTLVTNGPVDFCLGPPLHPPANSYVFTVGATAEDLAAAMLHNAKARGMTRIALITTTDATGHDVDVAYNTLMARPENKAFTVVANEHFAVNDISVAAQIARIKAANPQAILAWTVGTPTGTLFRGLRDGGVDLPVYESNANMLYSELGQFTDILPKELLFPAYRALVEGSASPAIHSAQAPFFASLKSIGAQPDIGFVLGWDAAMLTVDAMRKLGPTLTAAQLHQYVLAQKHWAGVNGYYDYANGNQRGLSADEISIDRWDAGKKTFVRISKPGGDPL
jgi:branched-chain amino acid transport system substrate-binding protein